MPCDSCGADMLLQLCGKTSDLCWAKFKGKEGDGYVPSNIGIGGGDYIELTLCMTCGKVQGWKPVCAKTIEKSIAQM